jgi:hypothetical protein
MYYLRCARQAPPATAASHSHLELPSPEFLLETNHPQLDQQVSIAFIVINTFFIALLFLSRYFNPHAVVTPMLVCNTLCYALCIGIAIGGICEYSVSLPLAPQTLVMDSNFLQNSITNYI